MKFVVVFSVTGLALASALMAFYANRHRQDAHRYYWKEPDDGYPPYGV